MVNDTPRDRRRAQTRTRILDAARARVATGGIDALTLGAIADALDLTAAALYRYFPNKDAVLAAIYDAETGREVADIRAAPGWQIDEVPLRDALTAIVDFQLERQRRHEIAHPTARRLNPLACIEL